MGGEKVLPGEMQKMTVTKYLSISKHLIKITTSVDVFMRRCWHMQNYDWTGEEMQLGSFKDLRLYDERGHAFKKN